MTTRQDAWSEDEDLLLAEVVLRHIREGGTQLMAFEEVGKKLSRTAAACGFRWNSYVRKQYKSGIELAKKQRKESKKQVVQEEKQFEPKVSQEQTLVAKNRISLQEVIEYLRTLEEQETKVESMKQTHTELREQVQFMEAHVRKVEIENKSLTEKLTKLEADYNSILSILNRASQMVKST
ncbi:RsfA family transcriptional regulator [Bacillus sp. HMF5848]|nr:RsfA family transcriptional regulator [Bacillus sp. HMF5848]RSK26927.1 RsfA family transcriptional regulator [Bacillus sp. HMF5848]